MRQAVSFVSPQTGDRPDADYGGSTISVDEAGDAIAKAEHVVGIVEHATAAGLGASNRHRLPHHLPHRQQDLF